jgi:hypothetical protein
MRPISILWWFALAAALAAFSYTALAQQPFSGGPSSGTGYPNGSLPIAASATGTTLATVATLAGSPGRTTFICGFTMTNAPGASATGTSANATVSNTIGGTLNFAYNAVITGQGLIGVAFPVCIPAATIGTAIVVTQPAAGTVQITAVTAWGYQL